MLKVRLVVASLGLAIILPAASTLFAQTASLAPAAPLPSQILTAKKVFISYAGGESEAKIWSGGPAQPYNELYAAIKSWGRYELVAAPGEADMVLQISYSDPINGVGVSTVGGGSADAQQIKLLLLDPKTQIVLWMLDEKSSAAHMTNGRDKCLVDAINKLVGDLKALTAQPAAPNAAK
jgi:hypothetical protein